VTSGRHDGSVPKRSAGLLVYRVTASNVVEVLIVHPGGPFWAKKDAGAWSIPKGEYEEGENARATAFREFEEEVGQAPPVTEPIPLGELTQPGGKRVSAWAVEGDLDVTRATSNTFEMEWPRGSGRVRAFPEVDRVEWMPVAQARAKLLKGQVPFLDCFMDELRARDGSLTEGPAGERS
jgi:predicted NUDIX family NTP pyrophosphohydrolase